jgi:hypothetical protein
VWLTSSTFNLQFPDAGIDWNMLEKSFFVLFALCCRQPPSAIRQAGKLKH